MLSLDSSEEPNYTKIIRPYPLFSWNSQNWPDFCWFCQAVCPIFVGIRPMDITLHKIGRRDRKILMSKSVREPSKIGHSLAKLVRCDKNQKHSCSCKCVNTNWNSPFLFRLCIFPTWIIYSVAVEAPSLFHYFPAYYVFNGLLALLLVSNNLTFLLFFSLPVSVSGSWTWTPSLGMMCYNAELTY